MRGRHIAVLGFVACLALAFALLPRPSVMRSLANISSTTTAVATVSSSTRTDPQVSSLSNAKPRRAHQSPTPIPVLISSTTAAVHQSASTSAPLAAVSLSIIDPDGKNIFAVDLKLGADACDVLAEAKAEGKIHSLTLDDSYKASFGSAYAREINGYSNDWTFTVNGAKPEGCSLIKPRAGDSIVWTFGG